MNKIFQQHRNLIKTLLLIVFANSIIGNAVFAKHLTPAEALSLARSASGQRVSSSVGAANMSLAFTKYDNASKESTVYVFSNSNNENGFMILSADDCVSDLVLGFSETNTFDPNNIPCGMEWLLEAYSDYVNKAKNGLLILGKTFPIASTDSRGAAPAKVTHQNIAPLVKTTWNQGSPYYNMCPKVGSQRCVTGCVATAMAQIMKYHEWPTKGVGSHSYEFTCNGTTYTASADFGSTTYDWSNMLNDYTIGNTTQKNAVATLMYHCGVASNMNYSPSGSGTTDVEAGIGMLNYFSYDKSMQRLSREWFTTDAWDNLIYEQLEKSQPVLYCGRTINDEGHAFVCDGYKDGFYHINWGWGGMSDGYFLLSNLDPDNQGIGGSASESAFNLGQSILYNIKKDEGSSIAGTLFLGNTITAAKSSYTRNSQYVTLNCVYYSYALATVNYTIGLKLVSSSQTEYITYGSTSIKPYSSKQNIQAQATSFPIGEWDVIPVFKTNGGDWQAMYFDRSKTGGYVHASVTSSTIKFTDGEIGTEPEEPEESGTISATYKSISPVLSTDKGFYAGHEYDFTYQITTDGKWSGDVVLLVFDTDSKVHSTSDTQSLQFSGAQTIDKTFRVKLNEDLPVGTYYVALAYISGGYYKLCSQGSTINITELKGEATVTGVTFGTTNLSGTSKSSPAILSDSANDYWVNASLKCTTAPWTDDVFIEYSDAETNAVIGQSDAQSVSFNQANQTTTLSYIINPWNLGLEYDKTYAVSVKGTSNGVMTTALSYFKLQRPEAVEVTLSELSATIQQGNTLQLVAYVQPSEASQNVTWSSTDKNVATVTADGLVTAVNVGSTEIIAKTENGCQASCQITVTPIDAETITLDKTAITLSIDDEETIIATVMPENATDKTVTWTTENAAVATVTSDGKVKAVGEGETTITATCGNASATCVVIVNKLAQEIVWTQEFNDVMVGDIIALTASATSGLDVAYSITKGADIATLDGNVITIKDTGYIEISATQEGNEKYAPAEQVVKTITNIQTGINSAYLDGDSNIIITTPAGLVVYKGSVLNPIKLPRGIYIIHNGAKTKKVTVK